MLLGFTTGLILETMPGKIMETCMHYFQNLVTFSFLRWKEELAKLGAAGGNSVRVWVHVEGDVSPLYNDDGYLKGFMT